MSTLVVNQSTCSGCATPTGQCYCHIRERVKTMLTANLGDAANASVAAAYKTLMAADDQGDQKAGRHALDALEATRDGDSEAAAKLHMMASQAHDAAADQLEEDGEGAEAKTQRSCSFLHRKAAAVHAVQSRVGDEDDQDDGEDEDQDDQGDDDEGMTDNASQPRHPHTGQYQGMTHLAAKRGASPEQDDDDDDDDQDEVDQDEADDGDESINTPNPACCSPGGLCPECEALKEYLRQPAGNKRRHKDDAEDDEAEECDEDDEECDDEQTTNRRTDMSSRDDDILYPPQTLRSIIVANATKAEGSNADLCGEEDGDASYGYSKPGQGRDSNYDAQMRTTHSVADLVGFESSPSPDMVGFGMSASALDSENQRRMGLGDLAERDLPPEQSVSPMPGIRPATHRVNASLPGFGSPPDPTP